MRNNRLRLLCDRPRASGSCGNRGIVRLIHFHFSASIRAINVFQLAILFRYSSLTLLSSVFFYLASKPHLNALDEHCIDRAFVINSFVRQRHEQSNKISLSSNQFPPMSTSECPSLISSAISHRRSQPQRFLTTTCISSLRFGETSRAVLHVERDPSILGD